MREWPVMRVIMNLAVEFTFESANYSYFASRISLSQIVLGLTLL
jgi:hypothetical protein